MRGKERHQRQTPACPGITPAYAGKSRQSLHIEKNIWDHHRLCGEKKVIRQCCYHGGGSPPPMRGKGRSQIYHGRSSGITPAYAGKSVAQAALNLIMRDHPRLCGEKSLCV